MSAFANASRNGSETKDPPTNATDMISIASAIENTATKTLTITSLRKTSAESDEYSRPITWRPMAGMKKAKENKVTVSVSTALATPPAEMSDREKAFDWVRSVTSVERRMKKTGPM